MRGARILYHLMRADFLERIRRYSFLITLGFTIYMGYIFVPANHSSYVTLQMGGHRGIYNSAWIGSVTAVLTSVFLSLAGFYVVKNALSRDEETRVGQIIATTPVSKPLYIFGKTLSNFAVLACMTGILILATGVMQIVRGEDLHIQPWALVAPFLFLTLPVLFLSSATAVLFETIPGLRRGFGNVVFFFLWMLTLVDPPQNGAAVFTDVLGQEMLLNNMFSAAEKAYPDYHRESGPMSMGITIKEKGQKWDLTTFRWEGLSWTPQMILGRLFWIGAGCLISLLSSLFFHRFDPARVRFKLRMRARKTIVEEERVPLFSGAHLSRLNFESKSRFVRVMRAELRLMLKGLRWWYVVTVGLMIGTLFAPMDVARGILLPILWIWPLTVWSAMGCREVHHRAEQLVFSAAYPIRRQLPAVWLAGVAVAMFTGSGIALRLLAGGDWGALFAWFTGTLFVPTFALTLGIWSGSCKLFEVLYLLLWYFGPMNRVPFLDYMGASTGSSATTAFSFLIVTAVLLALAVTGRRRQLQIA